MQKIIFHVDMDAFYASIEQRDHPDWREKPVVVGSQPGTRGVVSAASYEARRFGIHSAQPINQAYQACPKAIFTPPRMGYYSEVSRNLMAILRSYTPDIEPLSIDEAFLDMTGTERLWGSPEKASKKIQNHIAHDLNLTASIGVGPNKFLAKLASDVNKPNGVTVVPMAPDLAKTWLAPFPVNRIWGVGKVTGEKLAQLNIRTIKDLQELSLEAIHQKFGKNGTQLYHLARGIDHREIELSHEVKSISREHTFEKDCSDTSSWKSILLALSRDVAATARKKQIRGRSVVFIYRNKTFDKHSMRTTLQKPTFSAKKIFEVVWETVEKIWLKAPPLRLIGVGLTLLEDNPQADLFDSIDSGVKQENFESTLDSLKKEFGSQVVYGDEIKKNL